MTIRKYYSTMFVFVVLSACAPSDTSTQALSQDDKNAMKSVIKAYDQAWLERDPSALAALFTENALVMPPDAPIINAREEIQQWLAQFVVEELVEVPTEVGGAGNTGYIYSTYTVTASSIEEANPVTLTGRTIWIFSRQEDGKWLIRYVIWNQDHAPSDL